MDGFYGGRRELLRELDYLVNNAGAPWMTKALAAALKESHGAVVDTVSAAAFGGGGSYSAYATATAGR